MFALKNILLGNINIFVGIIQTPQAVVQPNVVQPTPPAAAPPARAAPPPPPGAQYPTATAPAMMNSYASGL